MSKPVINADEVLRDLDEPTASASEGQPSPTQLNTYQGIAQEAFPNEAVAVLMAPINSEDVEIRPDGLIYLPEIKYRRILNRAFGPGAWSLMPIEITVSPEHSMLYYRGALFVHGRFVSEAIGEQVYYPENDRMSYGTAAESAKSNCLMRCCKDLGIASELWDPSFVRRWIRQNAVEAWCINISRDPSMRGRKRKMWRKRSDAPIDTYPWREDGAFGSESPADSAPARRSKQPVPAKPDARQIDEATTDAASQATSGTSGNGLNTAEATLSSAAAARPVIISFRQARRFLAIARENQWNREEITCLLASHGFTNAEEITRRTYDAMCDALEDQPTHIAVREAIERGELLPNQNRSAEVQELPL